MKIKINKHKKEFVPYTISMEIEVKTEEEDGALRELQCAGIDCSDCCFDTQKAPCRLVILKELGILPEIIKKIDK